MGKILTTSILLFASIGMIVTGSLLIGNDVQLLERPQYKINKCEFEIDTKSNNFNQFTFSLLVTFGKISLTNVTMNLINWKLDSGLNQEVSINKHLTLTISPAGNPTKLNNDMDLSQYWIKFYLSNGDIITWSDNAYTTSKN